MSSKFSPQKLNGRNLLDLPYDILLQIFQDFDRPDLKGKCPDKGILHTQSRCYECNLTVICVSSCSHYVS